MDHYCTFFDHRYAGKGLALFWSLVRHCAPLRLYVLCLDEGAKEILLSLGSSEIEVIDFDTLCSWDAELGASKSNRSLVEFYFTCKPSLCLYILAKYAGIDTLTYLDSDIYYLGAPKLVFEELTGYSVGLTPHRFPSTLRVLEKVVPNGEFNAGWIFFRNDEKGRSCLEWWRSSCIDWCHDRVDEGRYADQGYLEKMQTHFTGVKVVENRGVNAGPWNLISCHVSQRGESVYVEDVKLICYHFHGMKNLFGSLWELGTASFGYRLNGSAKRLIYRSYAMELFKANAYCSIWGMEKSAQSIRTYKTRADSFFNGKPGLFRSVKLFFAFARGAFLNSLVSSR